MTNTYSGKYSNIVDDVTPYTPNFFLSGSRRFTKMTFGRSGGTVPPQVPPPRGAAPGDFDWKMFPTQARRPEFHSTLSSLMRPWSIKTTDQLVELSLLQLWWRSDSVWQHLHVNWSLAIKFVASCLPAFVEWSEVVARSAARQGCATICRTAVRFCDCQVLHLLNHSGRLNIQRSGGLTATQIYQHRLMTSLTT